MSNPAALLLAWYDSARRDLPWRETRDPYRVLLSEVMLQQTQVATVLPRYGGFLERFPSLSALAAAPLEEVLAAWSGLGYYHRARRLHQAAREIAALPGGFPRSAKALEKLSGIGGYTAAAVASIAFGEAVPVLDGNVERVLARRIALAEPASRAAARQRLRAAAAELLVAGRAGDSNQALMELGATLCRPRAPRCHDCPLNAGCVAHELGSPEAFPVKAGGRGRVRLSLVAAWVEQDGRLLLFRRGEGEELLAGLWELPTVAVGGAPEEELASRYGGAFRLGEPRGTFRHAITFRALEIEVVRATWEAGAEVREEPEAGWFTSEQLRRVATSSMVAKAIAVGRWASRDSAGLHAGGQGP